MNVPFLDLSIQEDAIREDRERRFAEIIGASAYVLGPHVAAFESEFSDYVGAGETVGVSGGTHAITMACNALGIGEGDEVLTIPTTFFASATGVIFSGATPVFCDIDPDTRNFDFGLLEQAVTERTKAILPVHLYGVPAEMDKILAFASRHRLLIIEDACQAHGARFDGRRVGTFGAAAAFSFYPGKNLGAYGDGGAVLTNDAAVAATVRALRNQGCVTKYEHEYLGYNARLDALQAAVLSAKLPHLDAWNDQRRSIADRYTDAFSDLPVRMPQVPSLAEPVWHLFVIEVAAESRSEFMSFLGQKGIATGIHYPVPLHLTPALEKHGYGKGAFPHAESLASRCVSLPLYPGMNDEQVRYVISAVKEYFNGNA